MFLKQLTQEEKKAFADLFIILSEADEDFAAEEFETFQDYCKEMNINFYDFEKTLTLDEITQVFRNASETSKKIAYFEAINIISTDGILDPREIDILYKFGNDIGIKEPEANFFVEKFNELNALELEIDKIICEE